MGSSQRALLCPVSTLRRAHFRTATPNLSPTPRKRWTARPEMPAAEMTGGGVCSFVSLSSFPPGLCISRVRFRSASNLQTNKSNPFPFGPITPRPGLPQTVACRQAGSYQAVGLTGQEPGPGARSGWPCEAAGAPEQPGRCGRCPGARGAG